VDDLVDVMGRATIEAILRMSAEGVAGPRRQGKKSDREVYWHGSQLHLLLLSKLIVGTHHRRDVPPQRVWLRYSCRANHSDLPGTPEGGGRKPWRRDSDTRPVGVSSEDDVTCRS
jgi:hypothetical protein